MKILHRGLVLAFSLLLFVLSWTVFEPKQGLWQKAAAWGQAPPRVRTAVITQLRAFQDGYTGRNTRQVGAFMDRLFSRHNAVVLGTLPREVYVGYDRAAEVIRTDWESWGDCQFRIEDAQVSAVGDVAWFATVGSVRFDLSRFLVLPLRLSGVMVNESGAWRLRQLQFQFDLDLNPLLASQMVLLLWAGVNLIWLLATVFRQVIGPRLSKPDRSSDLAAHG
jgi:hypothetical protein